MEALEAESIEIIREAAATAGKAVVVDAGDQRAWVLLRLVQKAFHPAPAPFPVVAAGSLRDGQELDLVLDPSLAMPNWTDEDVRRYIERESITVEVPDRPGADSPSLPGSNAGAPDGAKDREGPFRMPVQLVVDTDGFRGFSGRVAAGRVKVGDRVSVIPSGVTTRVKAIVRGLHAPTACEAGDSVTLTLMDDTEAGRGDVIAAADDPPPSADQFEARLAWNDEHAMVPGRTYFLRMNARQVSAQVTAIKYREDPGTGAHLAARRLEKHETGVVNISTNAPVVFEPYARNAAMGRFVLVDKLTLRPAGTGTIDFALRRAANLHWQSLDVDKQSRAQSMHQRPRCIWFTGLSGSGKSTLANLLEKRLHAQGRHTYVLDGDNVRHGLNRDLGFTEADRVENIRRVAEVAKLMVDAGLIVLVSFISPFRAERRVARALFEPGEFVEVFVDTPLEECERRDPKGLYAKARRGELRNMTGIDSPYEAPESPEVHINTVGCAPEELVRRIIERLEGARSA